MKIKNATFLDLHIEKIILGFAALFVVVVALLFLVGSPYQIELKGVTGGTKTVAPGDVGGFVASEVSKLDRALDANSDGGIQPPPDDGRRVNEFLLALNAPVTEDMRWVGYSLPGPPLAKLAPRSGPTPVYEVPTPPAPTIDKVRSAYHVLATLPDPQKDRQIVAATNVGTPRDFPNVLVRATFDTKAFYERWEKSAPDRKLPQEWFILSTQLVTDVILERQIWDQVKNEWGPVEVVKRLPTDAANFRNGVPDLPEEQRRNLVFHLRQNQTPIREPAFLPVEGVWTPTASYEITPEQQEKFREVQEKLRRVEQQISVTERRMEQLKRPDRPVTGTRTRYEPEEDYYEEEDRPGLQRPGDGRTTPRPAPGADEMTRLTQRLEELRRQEVELRRQKEAIIENVDQGKPGTGEAPARPGGEDMPYEEDDIYTREDRFRPDNRFGPGTTFGPDGARPTLSEKDLLQPINVWAHDISIRWGATVRYRVRLAVINPLFNKTELAEEQQGAANELSLVSEPSAWSSPVEVPRRYYYFARTASDGQATFEIWMIHNGMWRQGTLTCAPGDPLADIVDLGDGMQVSIDTGKVLINTVPASMGKYRVYLADAGGGDMSVRDPDADQNNNKRKQILIQKEMDDRQRNGSTRIDRPIYEDEYYEDEYYEPGMYEE